VSLVLSAADYREETVNPLASVSARRRLFLSTEVILPVLPSMTSPSSPPSSSSPSPLSLLFRSSILERTLNAEIEERGGGDGHCINRVYRSCRKMRRFIWNIKSSCQANRDTLNTMIRDKKTFTFGRKL